MARRIRFTIYIAVSLLVGLIALDYWISEKQERELLASWGVADLPWAEPYYRRAATIKPGMTQAEIQEIVRGYAWMERLPPDIGARAEGGTELYYYAFGIGRLWKIWTAIIAVFYDANGRVTHASVETS